MLVNQVIVGDEVRLDLTQDTVTPNAVRKGVTFHNAAGEEEEGTAEGLGGVQSITFNRLKHIPDDDGDIALDENDPTVGGWAKSATKPSYSADEVKAVDRDDTFTFEEIDGFFDTIFG